MWIRGGGLDAYPQNVDNLPGFFFEPVPYSLHAKFPDYQVFNGTQGLRFVFFKWNFFFFTPTAWITPIWKN